MARPLRLVEPTSEEMPVTYVVSRTQYVRPGTPYIVAALVDPVLAEDYRYADAELYTTREMRADVALDGALRAWDAGDHGVFAGDRDAHERVEAAYRASIIRSARRHPSWSDRG